MVVDRETVRLLESFDPINWEGTVYRHRFGRTSPEKENVNGARWNPEGVSAIYTSLERIVAIAEADYQISLQPLRPSSERKIYRIAVSLSCVLDLSAWSVLQQFSIDKNTFVSMDHASCQRIGGAVEWLGHDGMLVPSARCNGLNLVIFPNKQTSNYKFEVIDHEVLR